MVSNHSPLPCQNGLENHAIYTDTDLPPLVTQVSPSMLHLTCQYEPPGMRDLDYWEEPLTVQV
jgi:hypothetical protein